MTKPNEDPLSEGSEGGEESEYAIKPMPLRRMAVHHFVNKAEEREQSRGVGQICSHSSASFLRR